MRRQNEEFRQTRRAVANSKLNEYRKQCWRLAKSTLRWVKSRAIAYAKSRAVA
jgi:hypothetical protein